jgi:hypothetical protein
MSDWPRPLSSGKTRMVGGAAATAAAQLPSVEC